MDMRLGGLSLAVAGALLVSAAPVQAEQDSYLEAYSYRSLYVLPGDDARISTWHLVCIDGDPNDNGDDDCPTDARLTAKVSQATKRRLGLPSTTLATRTSKASGTDEDGPRIELLASRATRRALKKAASVEVRFTLAVRAPVTETVHKTIRMPVNTRKRQGNVFICTSAGPARPCD